MISVQDLTYRYDDITAVEEVSLTIDDDEVVVIVGANGSGKTTLVRHFNGLLTPDTGTVSVDGRAVTDDPVYARTTVGMVFQHPRDQFVAATIGTDVAFGPENLGLTREEIDTRVKTALAAVGLKGRRDERLDRLSGGEQARVAIAGALAMTPAHLVLDEPFAGLDWPARQTVRNHLVELANDNTGIVIVTHELRDIVSLADRIVVMADGQAVVDGPFSAVREQLAEYGVRPPKTC
ncbi:MAG: energy-coupling factor ABC transporter ATP-binding protein [Salinarchaeum sp.]